MKVTGTGQTGTIEPNAPTSEADDSDAPTSISLPAPSPDTDPLAAVYEILLQQQASGSSIDTARTQAAGNERHTMLEKQQDEEAKEHQGGRSLIGSITHLVGDVLKDALHRDVYDIARDTLHDISKDMINNPTFWDGLKNAAEVTGVAVASTASLIATGGASAPVLVAVALSAAAMLDSQARVLQSLGVSAKIAGFIDTGMSVAGAVVTLGASAGTTAADAESLAARAQVASKVVTATTAGVDGTATVAGGVLALHEAGIEQDATRDGFEAKKLQDLIAYVVEGMKEEAKGTDKALSTVAQTIKTRDDASLSLASFGKA